VNADGQHGRWAYRLVSRVTDIDRVLSATARELDGAGSAPAMPHGEERIDA
jgi:hypothetical protein